MLELERENLSLSVKKPLPFVSRPLIRTLLWSAFFHFSLLLSFRIKMTSFYEQSYPVTSIAVAIEEEIEPVITASVENERIMTQVVVDWDEAYQEIPRDHIYISKPPKITAYDIISLKPPASHCLARHTVP